MSVINTQPLIGASGNQGGGFNIDKSLRLRSSASSYLQKTFSSSPTLRTKYTFSTWFKHTPKGGSGFQHLFSSYVDGSNFELIRIDAANNQLQYYLFVGGVVVGNVITNAIFRDYSAWYNITLVYDSTLATSTDRQKLYVNGVRLTSLNTSVNTTQNQTAFHGYTAAHALGQFAGGGPYSVDGYLANIHFIDGQALTPDSFGEFDTTTGVWKPKRYTGTYGTNGFYLPFSSSSVSSYAGVFSGSNNLQAGTTATNFLCTSSTSGITATIEAWVKPTAYTTGASSWMYSSVYAKGGTYFNFGVYNGKVRFYWYDGGFNYVETSSTSDVPLNQWTNIAVTLNGNTIKIYVNGLLYLTSAAFTGISASGLNQPELIGIETGGNTRFTGSISNLRVSNTVLYSANFIPSIAPLTSSSSTKVLTLQNSTFVDNSSNNYTITNTGGVTSEVAYPFVTSVVGDASGNGNNWNPVNINMTSGSGVTYDIVSDVPTLTNTTTANYCVLNPLYSYASSVSDGNLKSTGVVTDSWTTSGASIGISSGKWYWEAQYTGLVGVAYGMIGIIPDNFPVFGTSPSANYPGATSTSYGYFSTGVKFTNTASNTYGASWTSNDVIGVALDMDAGTLTFYKNGVSQGVAFSGLTGTFFPALGCYNSTGTINFGQQPFVYSKPSGHKELNTYNLPDSTIVAGNKVMDATVYTGTGSALTVTNTGGFKPDFVWVKGRSAATSHILQDSVRGAGKSLVSNSTGAETGTTGDLISSFNSNGFTVNTNLNGGTDPSTDLNGAAYVGWQWQAGQGTTSTNTNGSTTSTVSVNPTAGFSIVSWATTSGVKTIGHGLGVAPSVIISKPRDLSSGWYVYHKSLGNTKYAFLHTTDVPITDANIWNNTSPTSTVFTAGSGWGAGYNIISYCWAEVAGFSKFGSYTGNGSTDGPFLYFGFRPKFVMIKRIDGTPLDSWYILDTSCSPTNVMAKWLTANASDVEGSGVNFFDALSNGIKLRAAGGYENASGANYIYMAFAENPFKNSLAR